MLRKTGMDKTKDKADDELLTILATDAQTSGGLLLCVDPDKAPELTARLRERHMPAAIVGYLRERAGQSEEIELIY
jgi:selenophosphate synthase